MSGTVESNEDEGEEGLLRDTLVLSDGAKQSIESDIIMFK